jgi:transposase
MDGIVPEVRHSVKQRLYRELSKCRDAGLRTRYLIIVNLIAKRSASDTAKAVGVSNSTVYRVAERFWKDGECGLVDRREDNGNAKIDQHYLTKLHHVVRGSPQDYGWKRPTWTREMLIQTMTDQVGVCISVSSMSRALAAIDARRGRPKPIVACPWEEKRKNARLGKIRRLIERLPNDEVAVYVDEVDIHLNPKIGLDWMVRGQQKTVLTPGKNEKRYLAGAQDAHTGQLHWVEGERKDSSLFVRLLWHLWKKYPQAKVIHVILDNYGIHKSNQTLLAVSSCKKRIRLHFLPPYCPDHNKIERTWEDLHANVTRNHRCSTMDELMSETRGYLRRRNQQLNRPKRKAG